MSRRRLQDPRGRDGRVHEVGARFACAESKGSRERRPILHRSRSAGVAASDQLRVRRNTADAKFAVWCECQPGVRQEKELQSTIRPNRSLLRPSTWYASRDQCS